MSAPDAPQSGDLTQDGFLGGQLKILQPRDGYRAGVDPVLLAASVEAKPGQSVLDLGCGVGTAALCVGRRVPGLALTGLEVQADYAELARRNGALNALELHVVTGTLAAMPSDLKAQRFDHVIANPPYFDRRSSTPSERADRERALGEDTPLHTWVEQAAKRTRPGGTVTFIHRVERLPELLNHFQTHLGSLDLLPFAPRENKRPRMVLLRGRKGGRADFRLCTPWVLHAGSSHDEDRESYTSSTFSVLREGAPLPFS